MLNDVESLAGAFPLNKWLCSISSSSSLLPLSLNVRGSQCLLGLIWLLFLGLIPLWRLLNFLVLLRAEELLLFLELLDLLCPDFTKLKVLLLWLLLHSRLLSFSWSPCFWSLPWLCIVASIYLLSWQRHGVFLCLRISFCCKFLAYLRPIFGYLRLLWSKTDIIMRR